MNSLKRDVGRRIFETRKKLTLSIDDLSVALDVSDGFIRLVETGKRGTSLENLVIVADLLSVSMDYLILGYEKEYDKEDSFLKFMSQFNISERNLLQRIGILLTKDDSCETKLEIIKLFVDYVCEYENNQGGK